MSKTAAGQVPHN